MECWSNSSSGHYLTNIPFILAGQGAGKFQTGRIVDAAKRNNNDLLISVQNASRHRLQRVRPGEPVQGADRLRPTRREAEWQIAFTTS